ncbi:hypothetical protein EYF80_039266 [Liparis tanakae]|uniref:Uncharacterized protein n=1 Tax=Liparis tanakae TaxID=230148 RepID=A0A4Z2GAB0_9TELE|nr:hypothetical protein EYF80_039266 [Liparis tanakae]
MFHSELKAWQLDAQAARSSGSQSSCTLHSAPPPGPAPPSAAPTSPPSVAHPPLKAFLIMAAIKAGLAPGSD